MIKLNCRKGKIGHAMAFFPVPNPHVDAIAKTRAVNRLSKLLEAETDLLSERSDLDLTFCQIRIDEFENPTNEFYEFLRTRGYEPTKEYKD